MKIRFFKAIAFVLFLWICGCDSRVASTPTSGEARIGIDESYTLLFDSEIYTFQSLYKNANIKAVYTTEKDAIDKLLKDSFDVIVLNRELNESEKEIFKQQNLFPKHVKVLEDAIAFVVNNDNPDTVLSYEQSLRVMAGIDTHWAQLDSGSSMGDIRIIFDNQNSANARYIANASKEGVLPPNAYAVKSNQEVIDYVSKNKNAIGVVSVSWISDVDDSLSIGFLSKVKVMGVSKMGDNVPYKPYQAYIKTKDYPFCRDVYMISRISGGGLGIGFVSFVAGDKGQRIILKSGLVPATAPTRLININPNQ